MPEVLDRFRSSTWGWLRGTLLGWLTLVLCFVGVGLIIILIQWLRFLDVTYELTEDRLILRKGIFVKSIDEIELYRVKDVRMDFTLINQWAGIGTIGIDSSDETTRDGALRVAVPFLNPRSPAMNASSMYGISAVASTASPYACACSAA